MADKPSYSIPVLRSSGSIEEESGVSRRESVEDRDDAAKKRAMDLESAKQNRIQREQIVENSLGTLHHFERLVNQTPAQFFPPQHWHNFPDVWILGYAKAGTSQLYKILTHHPELQAFNPRKEFCMDPGGRLNYSQPNEKLYSSLYSFHEFMNSNISKQVSAKKKLTVNACLNIEEMFLQYMYIRKYYFNASSYLGHKKFIIMVRDPADLLFSPYNFFSIPSFDIIGERLIASWSYESLDYRSPELFHELIVSGSKSLHGKSLMGNLGGLFVLPFTWIHLVGHENLLVLKNEDMLPETIDRRGGLIEQLSRFLCIDQDSFNSKIVKSRTNCNDGNTISRGMDTKCINGSKDSDQRALSSSYPISGNRAMLSQTRKLIYMIAAEACRLIKEYYHHVVYDGCR